MLSLPHFVKIRQRFVERRRKARVMSMRKSLHQRFFLHMPDAASPFRQDPPLGNSSSRRGSIVSLK